MVVLKNFVNPQNSNNGNQQFGAVNEGNLKTNAHAKLLTLVTGGRKSQKRRHSKIRRKYSMKNKRKTKKVENVCKFMNAVVVFSAVMRSIVL